jgi:hypothetical protein
LDLEHFDVICKNHREAKTKKIPRRPNQQKHPDNEDTTHLVNSGFEECPV